VSAPMPVRQAWRPPTAPGRRRQIIEVSRDGAWHFSRWSLLSAAILSARSAARLVESHLGRGLAHRHTFNHDRFHLARAVAAEGRSPLVFRRCEAGDALLERGEFNDDEAVKLVRPFHDLVAAAAREHLAAELGNDA